MPVCTKPSANDGLNRTMIFRLVCLLLITWMLIPLRGITQSLVESPSTPPVSPQEESIGDLLPAEKCVITIEPIDRRADLTNLYVGTDPQMLLHDPLTLVAVLPDWQTSISCADIGFIPGTFIAATSDDSTGMVPESALSVAMPYPVGQDDAALSDPGGLLLTPPILSACEQ